MTLTQTPPPTTGRLAAEDSPAPAGWRTLLPTRIALIGTAAVWAPMLVWFAAFKPGLMSADSLNIFEQATKGGWYDLHPPLYTAAMWASTELVGSPSLLTLGQSLFLASSVVAVALALIRLGANRRAVIVVTGVLAVMPTVGAFAVSIWKDIPYSAAFLFTSARVIDLVRGRLHGASDVVRRAAWSLVGWCSLLVALRQNGVILVVVLATALFLTMSAQRRQMAMVAVVPIALLAVLKVVVYPAMDVAPPRSQLALLTPLHDIAAVQAVDPTVITGDDRALLESIAPLDLWRDQYNAFGCASSNWQWDTRFDWTRVEGEGRTILSLWLHVAKEHPVVVLRNRLCVGAIAFRPDNNGHALYTVSRGVDPNNLGLHTAPLVSGLDDRARDVLDAFDNEWVQPIAWRAPGWIYAAYLVLGVVAWRRRRPIILLLGAPLLALQLSVFPVNPAQDARYMVPGLILAVMLLPVVSLRGGPDRLARELEERPSA